MKKEYKEFLRFAIGGAPGSGLGYLILYIFIPSDSEEMFLSLIISFIAFLVKEIVSFSVHKWWTFKKEGNTKKEIVSYTKKTIYLAVANSICFLIATEMLNLGSVTSQVLINIIFSFINSKEVKKVFKKD